MDFTVKVDGLERISKASDRVKAEVVKELEKGLSASAQRVRREAIDSIRKGQKSGRVYTHYFLMNKKTKGLFAAEKRDKPHRASAPGEPPASDGGRLISSITAHVNKISLSKLESFVVAGRGVVKYARMLEFGTAKMGARPFMSPAYQRSKEWIKERLNKAVRTAAINASKRK